MMKQNLCDSCVADCGHYIEPGEFVVECGAYRPPATNADHIRAMSDEELAEQLVINVDGLSKKRVYLAAPVGEIFARRDIAEAHVLVWLQQPYKEDET